MTKKEKKDKYPYWKPALIGAIIFGGVATYSATYFVPKGNSTMERVFYAGANGAAVGLAIALLSRV